MRRQGTFFARVDQKGRISIPSSLRKSFRIKKGDALELLFDLEENVILLLASGQDGVKAGTRACEALGPGSKGQGRLRVLQPFQGNPGPDPLEKKGVKK